MKLAPDFFQKGEELAAAKLNSLVAAVRSHRPYKGIDASGENRVYPPFEPISVDYSDEKWRLILQPSYIVSGAASEEIFFGDDPLSAYPEIEVEPDKHLYLNLSSGVLEWKEEGDSGLLVIEVVTPEEEEDEGVETRTFRNAHPSLVFNSAPAFNASVVTVGEEQKIAISPGYLITQNIGDDEPVKLHTPTMGGTAIDANPEPIAAAPYIYLYVETDHKGKVTGTPEVQGSSSEQDSTHHEPNEEITGEYYFLLAETETTEGRVRIKKRITGNRYLPNQLVEIKNVGGERELHKGYLKADDKHEFRSLKQLPGRGEELIKSIPEGTEEDPPDTVDFRRLVEREEEAQIHVVAAADEDFIEIRGNSYDGGVSDATKVSIVVQDGLVTFVGSTAPPEEEGKDLNLSIFFWMVDGGGGVYSSGTEGDFHTQLWFRNGKYVGRGSPEEGPPASTGTEGDPGEIHEEKVSYLSTAS